MPLTNGCLLLATEKLLLTVVLFPGIFIFPSLLPLQEARGAAAALTFYNNFCKLKMK